MPKINTHLDFANEVIQGIESSKLAEINSNNKREFLIGSIFPDIFFYRINKRLFEMSEYIHGKEGNKTNELLFDILNVAKEKQDEKILAFVFGFVTHTVLDMKLHPLIYYLAGNYYDENKERQSEAVYQHIKLETMLDKSIAGKNNINGQLKSVKFLKLLKDVLNQKEIYFKDIQISHKIILFIDSKFLPRRSVHGLARILVKIKLLDRKYLGLFYNEVKNEKIDLDKMMQYRDLITGEQKKASFNILLQEALEEVILRIEMAYKYYNGETSLKEAKKVIKGENLSVGKEGVASYAIKYTRTISNSRF